jgi:DNA-binding transcriptional LysR family regulator
LADRIDMPFAQALEWEHVGMPVDSAVQVRLVRAAAEQGRSLTFRVIVSSFEAALRVVRARLAISVMPREIAEPYAATHGLRVVPLTDAWAQRRFTLCYRDELLLTPAARLLIDHLGAVA